MVVGDVVSAITSVATGASATYQPAAGVEVAVVSLMGAIAGTLPSTYIQVTGDITDGTNNASFFQNNTNHMQKVFIINARFLRVTNNNAATVYVGYTGMQTK